MPRYAVSGVVSRPLAARSWEKEIGMYLDIIEAESGPVAETVMVERLREMHPSSDRWGDYETLAKLVDPAPICHTPNCPGAATHTAFFDDSERKWYHWYCRACADKLNDFYRPSHGGSRTHTSKGLFGLQKPNPG